MVEVKTTSGFSYAGKFSLEISPAYSDAVKHTNGSSEILDISHEVPLSRDRYSATINVSENGLIQPVEVKFGSRLDNIARIAGFFSILREKIDILTLLRYEGDSDIPNEALQIAQYRGGNDPSGFYAGGKIYIPSSFVSKPNPRNLLARATSYGNLFDQLKKELPTDLESIVACIKKVEEPGEKRKVDY